MAGGQMFLDRVGGETQAPLLLCTMG